MDSDAPKPVQTPSAFTPPEDPSKYIRTYAKDVAMLTKTPLPTSPASTTTTTSKVDDKKDADALGVGLPDFDPSPVNRSGDPASPKEFKQEEVVLSESDSDNIFTAKKSATEDREAILDRLRAKVAASQKGEGINLAPQPSAPIASVEQKPFTPAVQPPAPVEPVVPIAPSPAPVVPVIPTPPPLPDPIPKPTPVPVEPLPVRAPAPAPTPIPNSLPVQSLSESPLRSAAPTFASSYESVPSIPQVKPFPQTAPVAQPATTPAGPSPIHTFTSDFADHIDKEKSSTFSVLAAQSDAGQTPRPSAKTGRRNFLPLLAGAGMVVIGIGAVIGAYMFARNSQQPASVAGVPSLITYDESVELTGTGTALAQALSDASQGTSIAGNVVVAYTTSVDATTGASGGPQPGGALIKALALPAPDILLRNIDDSSTVGYIHAGSESRPFFVLKVNSYERTFAGMLAWEATMPSALATLYPRYADMPTFGSTTASTSQQVVLQGTPHFTDGVVSNYDVRVLRDSAGRSLMLYGYHGKDTLIIARDEAAFTALIARLSATGN